MTEHSRRLFPKHFLWGASVSAHQVEGGLHNQWTRFELESAKTLAAQAEYHYADVPNWNLHQEGAKDPNNYVSGGATKHATLYERDFDLLSQLHMNAFRFSIEWSRIEPREGEFDEKAIQFYTEYVDALRARHIEPFMTLFHFTLPEWFADIGGFEKKGNIKYFIRFIEKVMATCGKNVRYIITINEPEVYAHESYFAGHWPPQRRSKLVFWRVLRNLIVAHRRAAKVIHASSRRHKVSIAQNSVFVYPGDNAWLSRVSAAILQYVQDDYVLKRIRKHSDFIGINYYMSQRVYGYRVHNPEKNHSDVGWDLAPENLEYVLERVYEKHRLPIIVTENGIADSQDVYRRQWLEATIKALVAARSQGVPVEGYLHWSLIDNFEWEKGRWPRFGLAAVDYRTFDRTLRPSAKWFGAVIHKLRGDDHA